MTTCLGQLGQRDRDRTGTNWSLPRIGSFVGFVSRHPRWSRQLQSRVAGVITLNLRQWKYSFMSWAKYRPIGLWNQGGQSKES